MVSTEYLLKLAAQGGQQTAKEVELVEKSLEATRKEVETTNKTFRAMLLNTGMDRLEDQIDDATASAQKLNSEIDELIQNDAYNEDMDRFVASVRQAFLEVDKLNSELAATPDISSKLNGKKMLADYEAAKRNALGGASTGGGFRTESAGQVLSGLSQVTGVGQLQFGADLVGLVGDSKEAAEGLKEMGIALAPIGGLAIAGAGAFLLVNHAIAAGVKVAEEAAEAHDAYIRRLELGREADTLSADELQSRIQETQNKLQDEIAARDQYIQDITKGISESKNLTQGIAGLTAALGLNVGVYGEVKDQVDIYNDTIDEQTAALQRLNAETNRANREAEVERAASKGEEAALNAITALQEEAEFSQWVREQQRDATVENANEQIDAVRQQLRANADLTDFLKSSITETQRLMEGETDAAKLARLNGELETFQAALVETEGSTSSAREQLSALTNQIMASAVANERYAEAQERNIAAQETAAKQLEDSQKLYNQTTTERDAVAKELANTENQLLAIESERAKTLNRQAQTEALAASQSARLGALDAQIDAAKKQAEVATIQQDAANKQVSINSKLNTDVQKLNSDFMNSELKAIQDFNKERKRLTREGEQALLQAALDNDVNAFLAARSNAVDQLSDQSEDFTIERERAAQAREQRLAELEATAQAEMQLLQQTTQEKLLVARQGGESELAQVRALEAQKQQLQAVFAQENKALQAKFAQEDYDTKHNALTLQADLTRQGYEQLAREAADQAINLGRVISANLQNTILATVNAAMLEAF